MAGRTARMMPHTPQQAEDGKAVCDGCTTNDHQPLRKATSASPPTCPASPTFAVQKVSKGTLTGDSVHPVPNVVPARHQQRTINRDKLHVVDVHVEGVLLRPHEIPLLYLVNGQVQKHVAGSLEDFSSNRLTNLKHRQHTPSHQPIITYTYFSSARNKHITSYEHNTTLHIRKVDSRFCGRHRCTVHT